MADITEPFPLFRLRTRYLLYDVNVISHIRRAHHICGTLIGNIPLAAQQNVFSGIPLELMPEEARLLVSAGAAYVVDDVAAHARLPGRLDEAEMAAFVAEVHARGVASAMGMKRQAEERKSAHADKIERAKRLGLEKQRRRQQQQQQQQQMGQNTDQDSLTREESDALFGPQKDGSTDAECTSAQVKEPLVDDSDRSLVPHNYTPTTSYPPLVATASGTSQAIPEATAAYYLFAYLHARGYFMLPGLRFGCQFVAYPGDPLRYHSHFLSVSKTWHEPIDLIDIVGGGRLGTGVKKGYLVGGVETKDGQEEVGEHNVGDVRVFCFEWAAM